MLFIAPAPLPAQGAVTAFVGARLLPVSGPAIAKGTMLVQRGKIVAIGADGSITVPEGATRVDLSGKTVIPGIVDTHSHIGGWGGGDQSSPTAPETRIFDAINVRDSGFRRAASGGLTAINIMPGSGLLMSGQTLYVKNRRGARVIDDMTITGKDGKPMGGLKMANGTNPIDKPPFPGNRSKSMAIVRQLFIDAQTYKREKKKDNPGMDALVEVLDGKRIVHHHTHRADDIASVLRLKREFGFRLVLQHVSEAWKMADEIAKEKVPCSIISLDAPGGKLEAAEVKWINGHELVKRGVSVGFHTDDGITDSRLLLRSAAYGVRGGMSEAEALNALTLAPAAMMDLQDRTGSLEQGKDADFVVLSGAPFALKTKVEQTWVEGLKVFDRSDPNDYKYAVGGPGASHDIQPYHCCFEGAGH